MRVLVYDSSKDIMGYFVNVLMPEGFEVVTVKHFKDIVKMFTIIPINVAIIEISVDDKNAADEIAKMKFDEKYADIKIIVSVQNPTKEFLSNMIEANVDGFFLKPIKKQNLLERFKKILNKADIEIKHLHAVEVEVNEKQNLVISFRTNRRQIIASIKTMSTDYISFVLSHEIDSELEIGDSINSVQLDIAGSRYFVSAVVKDKKEKKCFLRFNTISDNAQNAVYKYVHEIYMQNIIKNKGFLK